MNGLLKTIHLAATDSHFRVQLQADPRVAIASLGLTLDDEALAERHKLRKRFWTLLLERAREKTYLHAGISPG